MKELESWWTLARHCGASLGSRSWHKDCPFRRWHRARSKALSQSLRRLRCDFHMGWIIDYVRTPMRRFDLRPNAYPRVASRIVSIIFPGQQYLLITTHPSFSPSSRLLTYYINQHHLGYEHTVSCHSRSPPRWCLLLEI
jgi:hypothetical protein